MIDWLSDGQVTHVGVGLIITVMIYALGHVSGAHFNPTVTLGFVLARHFPLRRLVGYWTAQVVGATLAAATLRLLLGMSPTSEPPSRRAAAGPGSPLAWRPCSRSF